MVTRIKSRIKSSTPVRALQVFDLRDRKRIYSVALLQMSLGFLDLLGVAIIGVIGALAINGVQSKAPGNRVSYVLDFFHLSNSTIQVQVGFLAIAATITLVSRTIFSIYFTRRTLRFLGRKSADLSNYLVTRLFNQPLIKIQEKTVYEHIYAITSGVNSVSLGVVATTINMVADVSLLILMSLGLFLVNPVAATASYIVFGLLGMKTFQFLKGKARNLGLAEAKGNIEVSESIMQLVISYREAFVGNRRQYFTKSINDKRIVLADTMAEISFLPNISKYVVEVSVVLFALLISATQFLLLDASKAIATLAIFLAAGSRIAPALMRVQQGALQIKGSIGAAHPTLELLEDVSEIQPISNYSDSFSNRHENFEPTLSISKLRFSYSNSPTSFTLEGINLNVKNGELVALVGPSGSGKTSLVDLILGLHEPDSGEIHISGHSPQQAIKKYPGAIAYVPQDVVIFSGTIKDNVCFGHSSDSIQDSDVLNALRAAELGSFIESLERGIHTSVGDRGTSLSGGQRQRLGIARALLSKPKLLLLDEATSALDAETEFEISKTLQNLRGEVTLLLIAHRLSTVRQADQVIYLENGRIKAEGSFEEVRRSVPAFERQATLLGL